MISKLRVKNFRSFEDVEIDFGKITVLTGANNSGKSSIIYSLVALRNAIASPNKSIDGLFNYNFINLGGFNEVVCKKDKNKKISISLSSKFQLVDRFSYEIELSNNGDGKLKYQDKGWKNFNSEIVVNYPHSFQKFIDIPNESGLLRWNGIEFQSSFPEFPKNDIMIYDIFSIENIPISRGFTKAVYARVPLNGNVYTEDELATLIASDENIASQISHYLNKIVNKNFSVEKIKNTDLIRLITIENNIETDLVNEGTGINQIVTILAKILQKNYNSIICIDEPEIHLHPSIIKKFIQQLIIIAKYKSKKFLFSTHSETLVLALLEALKEKEQDWSLSKDEVKIYYLNKTNGLTNIERQDVNDKGQIEGGLKNFYQSELENLDMFFKVD
jgi:predicted ATPase